MCNIPWLTFTNVLNSYYGLVVFFLINFYWIIVTLNVSAVQPNESAICIHVSPLSWISFSFRSPQSTEFPVLYIALVICFIRVSIVYICRSQSPSLLHPHCAP